MNQTTPAGTMTAARATVKQHAKYLLAEVYVMSFRLHPLDRGVAIIIQFAYHCECCQGPNKALMWSARGVLCCMWCKRQPPKEIQILCSGRSGNAVFPVLCLCRRKVMEW
jgi:hypothetical protein